MHPRVYTPIWTTISVAALVLALGGSPASTIQRGTQQQSNGVSAEPHVRWDGFAAVVRSASPAVVSVSSSRTVRVPEVSPDSPVSAEFLRQNFSEELLAQLGPLHERREHNRGSGVIVSRDGYVLTNHHMIEGATEVIVALSDDREFVGKVVGSDPGTDIAVLKIKAHDLPYISFADSTKVEVGDLALAIGNPFGIGRTVTMGIVGATGRGGLGIEDYEDFIQTDASINPGNSGGALTNARGELIGINTAILSPNGLSSGIGFAVPSNLAHQVMDQIMETGKVTRGFMGATIQDLTPNLAAAMNSHAKNGALVGDVDSGGPAARGGLLAGDVVVELNGKPIKGGRDVRLTLGAMHPGEQVSLGIQRNGQRKTVTFVLAAEPANEDAVPSTLALAAVAEQDMGVRVRSLTPQIRERLNLAETVKGIIVVDVADGSAAAEADLHPGDIVEQVNRKLVQTEEEFAAAVSQATSAPLLLRVNRKGHGLFLAVK